MKNLIVIIPSFFLVTTIISCNNQYKLKEGEINYIPYKGNEVLVFHSDKNRVDTIFLKGMSHFNGCGDPLDIYPDHCDGIKISCTKTDPNYNRHLEGKELVQLLATPSGDTRISFDITLKGSWFYNLDSYSLSEFDNMPNTELIIDGKVYNDVKIFEANDFSKQFSQRDNYVERFYWSVRHGFLGLDRRDESWRFIEKYVP